MGALSQLGQYSFRYFMSYAHVYLAYMLRSQGILASSSMFSVWIFATYCWLNLNRLGLNLS